MVGPRTLHRIDSGDTFQMRNDNGSKDLSPMKLLLLERTDFNKNVSLIFHLKLVGKLLFSFGF